MRQDELQLPEDFQGEVRLFPLPNAVFFPATVMPLHIFESRYREMAEDALEGDQLIAMATLEAGFEIDYFSRPPIAKAVCIGIISGHQKNEDGTYHVVLLGLRRAIILGDEISPIRAYRRATVQMVDVEPCDESSAEAIQQRDDFARRLVEHVPSTQRLVSELLKRDYLLDSLTDTAAFRLPLDVDFKLSLLSEPKAVARATMLLSHVKHHPIVESADDRSDFCN